MKKTAKILLIFWLSFFVLVFAMGLTRHVYTDGEKLNGTSKETVVFLSTFISNITNFSKNSNPQFVPNVLNLKNGFNHSSNCQTNKDYLLIPTWDVKLDQTIVKLIRIRDNQIMHKWIIDLEPVLEKFNQTFLYGKKNDLTIKSCSIQNPYLSNDGSLVFGAGGICKVDKNAKLVWTHYPNSHHSVELDPDGNFWVSGYNSSLKTTHKYGVKDDVIKKLSFKTGKVIFEKSVFEILMENGYNRALLLISRVPESGDKYMDYIHLNDVQPVFSDSKYWKKGDLFISIRNQNMVFLYRPSTNQILWSQNGPWLKQHDVNIIDSTRISIFGNNVIYSKSDHGFHKLIDGHNVQYVYDFSTNICSTPYHDFFKSAKIGTITEGRSRILSNGDICVEETNKGRILYGNTQKELWSYVEKMDNSNLGYISWSRYITAEEFKKFTFISKKNK